MSRAPDSAPTPASAVAAAAGGDTAGEQAEWMERLAAVEGGLRAAAARAASDDLTEPDQASGEQWEEGQVWAHLSEFVPYWIAEARSVLAGTDDGSPPPFGRIKSDAGRVAAIAERRHAPVDELAAVVLTDCDVLRSFLTELGDTGNVWSRAGRHSTLGVLTMHDIFEEFLVGHLEQHLRQLDGLHAD